MLIMLWCDACSCYDVPKGVEPERRKFKLSEFRRLCGDTAKIERPPSSQGEKLGKSYLSGFRSNMCFQA
jgi:hypothetical protein